MTDRRTVDPDPDQDRSDAIYGYGMLATAVIFGALCGGLGVWLGCIQ